MSIRSQTAPGTLSLTTRECLTLLRSFDLGRIGVLHEGYPAVFPINYVVARIDGNPVIAIRTRPDNPIDQHDELVTFEIDGVDSGYEGGWSVLVQGRLTSVVPSERFDSHPLVTAGRDAWRVIVPHNITGRRVVATPLRWPYHGAA